MGRAFIAEVQDRGGASHPHGSCRSDVYTWRAHGRRSATPSAAARVLERPVSTRIYRAAWLVVAVPVLVAAFSVGRPDALPPPRAQPFFDQDTALQFTTELTRFPDRSPGTEGHEDATDWVEDQLEGYGFTVERQTFSAEIPGLGTEELVNLVAVAPRSGPAAAQAQRAIVVLAHRDNTGVSPGADDNASGTGALLELARDLGSAAHAHPIVLVSTDGGAFGGLGADYFARSQPYAGRIAALVNLDAIGSSGHPRIEFAGDTPRVPSPTLLATIDEAIAAQAGSEPNRPGALAQLVDLAFPFSFYEQAPFVSRGVPAVTVTTGGSRPRGRRAATRLPSSMSAAWASSAEQPRCS